MTPARNPVGWFEIYVRDMDRAKTFYEAVFAVKLERLSGTDLVMYTFPMRAEAPGCAGALVHYAGKQPGDGGTLVYFSCVDCAVEAGRAAKHGGRIHKEKFSIGEYGYVSLVIDPEGNLIGLHSRT